MKKLRGNQGFTIVETMIVLAIAGLILLVVLLAIPALERSSRNNQQRQDVQTLLLAISHYELNNSGTMPSAAAPLSAADLSKLTYYDRTNITYQQAPCMVPNTVQIAVCISANWTDAPASLTTYGADGIPHLGQVFIYNHEVCDPSTGGAVRTGAGFSSVVALYGIESGQGGNIQCQQL